VPTVSSIITSKNIHSKKRILGVLFIISLLLTAQTKAQLTYKPTSIDSLKQLPLKTIAANYYSSQLGLMCKKELQLEKAIKLPLRIRLGSVEQVDKLEGKKRH